MGKTKKIPLTKGKFATVDEEDYPYLSRFTWQAAVYKNQYRAVRTIGKDGKDISLPMECFLITNRKGFIYSHINGDTLDNRKENLTTISQPHKLQKAKKRTETTSKYKGVYWDKRGKRWAVSINKNNKKYHIGYFKIEVEAALAYNEKAKELYGEMAYQNIIK